jgi:hypothetical protein
MTVAPLTERWSTRVSLRPALPARLRGSEWRRRFTRPVLVGITALGVLLWIQYIFMFPIAIDGHAYYAANPSNLYARPEGDVDAYFYSPAFAQLMAPLQAQGWDVFRTIWRLAELAALTALVGPFIGLALFIGPLAGEINVANVHLLLAAAMVYGLRWPAAWSFVLLTKVTPGIGLLWFVVRREWRSLGIALGATAAIALVSLVLAPGLWVDWILALYAARIPPGETVVLGIPLLLRVLASAAIVVWGAQANQRWTVVVAGFVALPVTWLFATSMLVAIPAAVLSGRFGLVRHALSRPAPAGALATNSRAGLWPIA